MKATQKHSSSAMTADASLAPATKIEAAKQATPGQFTPAEERKIKRALGILEARHFGQNRSPLSSPISVKNYLALQLGGDERERFFAIWLDASHRPIAFEEIAHGTLCQVNVYAREVVKSALLHNAAAVIFAHNHPSGSTDPSQADEHLTEELRKALGMVGISLLDHFVIAGSRAVSMQEERERQSAKNAATPGQAQKVTTPCTTQSMGMRAAASGPSLLGENSYFGDVAKPFESLFRLMAGHKCGEITSYMGFEAERLEAISNHANNVKGQIFYGLQGIGEALAIAAATGELDKQRISGIGWFLSNLGELAEACENLASEADFARSQPRHATGELQS